MKHKVQKIEFNRKQKKTLKEYKGSVDGNEKESLFGKRFKQREGRGDFRLKTRFNI